MFFHDEQVATEAELGALTRQEEALAARAETMGGSWLYGATSPLCWAGLGR